MRGARRERCEGLPVQVALGEPTSHALPRRRRQKKLRWAAIGMHVECARGLEVALGHPHVLSVHVDLRGDQCGPSEFAFRVA